jgi:hypothetical protein
VPRVLEVRLRHDGHLAEAGRGGRGDADAGHLPAEDGNQHYCSPSLPDLPPKCR